jgi:hypothetical protein
MESSAVTKVNQARLVFAGVALTMKPAVAVHPASYHLLLDKKMHKEMSTI